MAVERISTLRDRELVASNRKALSSGVLARCVELHLVRCARSRELNAEYRVIRLDYEADGPVATAECIGLAEGTDVYKRQRLLALGGAHRGQDIPALWNPNRRRRSGQYRQGILANNLQAIAIIRFDGCTVAIPLVDSGFHDFVKGATVDGGGPSATTCAATRSHRG